MQTVLSHELTEYERIFAWRQFQFEKLGCTHQQAATLALNTTVELRKLERLLNAGCSLTTAILILT